MGGLEALWVGFLKPVLIGVTPLVLILGLLKYLIIKDFNDPKPDDLTGEQEA